MECNSCVFRHLISAATLQYSLTRRGGLEMKLTTTLASQGVASAPGTKSVAPSYRLALATLSLSMLMPSFDTSIANAGLPALARAFAAPFQQVQWIVLSYLLAITTLIVSAGRLGDLAGRRRLLLAGIAGFTLASLLCGLAPTLPLLVAARAAQGFGAAIMMALTVAFVADTIPSSRTGSAMGLLGTMSAIGTTLGPSLGGFLIASLGWRWMFLINVPLGILNVILVLRSLPADTPKTANRSSFDGAGTLLLASSLAAYALAMTTGRNHFGARNAMLLGVAAIGGGLFLLVELRVASPLVRVGMFRDYARSASLAMSVLVSTVIMSTLVVGPFYLSGSLGLGAAHVGLVLAVGPLVAAIAGVPAGRLVDRFGAQRMTVAGLAGMVLGASLLAISPMRFGVAGYLAPIVMLTSSYALFQAANNTSIMSNVAPGERGVISGMLSLSRNVGLITGAAAMGAVFSISSGVSDFAHARPDAIATGMHTTFAVAAIVLVLGLAIAGARSFANAHRAPSVTLP